MISSSRLGSLTAAQFQAALSRFQLGEFLSATAINGGMGKQNIFVTATSGEYVLRGNPLFPGQFAKEQFFADLLHAHTEVPVPHPYLIDPSTDIFGWSYVLMPRLPGDHLTERRSVNENDLETMFRLLSETLVEIHAVPWPRAGEYDADTGTIEPFAQSLAQRESEMVRSRLAWAHNRTGRMTEADIASDISWVERILTGGQLALETDFTPAVVMHDYQLGNVLFSRDEGGWRISAVFDLAEAYIGDPEADLARMITALLRHDNVDLASLFVQHYLALRPPRTGFLERLAVYMLDYLIIEWGFVGHERQLSFRDWANRWFVALPTVANSEWSSWSLE